ncbi:hypothetical protein BO94DRAFT_541096 [Aspergillus sclerotioniger CBS 115572]|uniref:Uncharacterized protein n=1 Tax=Aspergillus sclerotioniger CBS 115572 TaxID=1450535 RepID=A0A317XCL6_9EURO|nr:hypothetical protein BO94DRAFT_541096 [Aspergillus sclerotioniger CBS 115572]PWY96259.1 hypothetical protein BO94DRAFT_541096 [Aspergillus sclerotioniger CBS 115572]
MVVPLPSTANSGPAFRTYNVQLDPSINEEPRAVTLNIDPCQVFTQKLAYFQKRCEAAEDENNGMVFQMEMDEPGPAAEMKPADPMNTRNILRGEPRPALSERGIPSSSVICAIENTQKRCNESFPDSDSTITLESPHKTKSKSPTDPFPEYYASCETAEAHVDKEVERAYEIAISKVCEEVIRFREVSSDVTSPPPFTMEDVADHSSSKGNGNGPIRSDSPVPPSFHMDSEVTTPQLSEHSGAEPRPGLAMPENRKKDVLEKIRIMVNSDRMKPATKRRFVAMCNIILRIEYLLFRRHQTPVDPVSFLTGEEVEEVMYLAGEIIKYLTIINNVLLQELDCAQHVQHSIKYIAEDKGYNVVTRFKSMAEVIINHLNKPRPSEQRLLAVFLDFFDSYIYTDFISIRHRQIRIEETWNPIRMQMTRLMVDIWDMINRAIENYDAIVKISMMIKREYIEPALNNMREAPSIWRDVMIQHHIEAQSARLRQSDQQAQIREQAREHARILVEQQQERYGTNGECPREQTDTMMSSDSGFEINSQDRYFSREVSNRSDADIPWFGVDD